MKRQMLEEAIAEAKTIKETAIASAKAALEEAFTPQLTAMFAEKLNEMEDEDEKKKSVDENDSLDELDLEEILAELESDNMNEEKSDDQPLEEELMLEEMSDEDIEELVTKVIDDMIASGKLVAGEESEEDLGDEDDMEDFDIDAIEDDADVVDEELDIDALLAEISGGAEEDIDADLEEILAEMDRLDEESELEEAKKSKKDEDEKDEELKEAYEAIATLRAELNEVNLLNAKLLYTNKIFKAKNLTESEKVKVLNTFDKAETVKEVKLVFETLTESLKAPVAKKNPIKESLGGASKTVVVEQKQEQIIEVNEAFARMQRLAGLRK